MTAENSLGAELSAVDVVEAVPVEYDPDIYMTVEESKETGLGREVASATDGNRQGRVGRESGIAPRTDPLRP